MLIKATDKTKPEYPSGNSRVRTLLVGDNLEIRRDMENALRGRGHEVCVCEDVDEAWKEYNRDHPMLVVLACTFTNSMSLTREILRVSDHMSVTILAVVPQDEQNCIPDLIEAGADDYVLSPLDSFRLNARIMFAERKARDKAEQKKVALELEARIQQQAVVSELGRKALAGEEPQDIMDYAVQATARALDVPYCRILERTPDGQKLLWRAAEGWDKSLIGRTEIPVSTNTQAGYTLVSSTPVVIDDLNAESRFNEPEMLRDVGIVSGMSVAIPGEGGPYGILSVHTPFYHRFSEDDSHFLNSVANVLAAAIEQKRAEAALRDSEAKSRAILETTVDGVITIDEQGIITSFNPAAERIFGFTAAEAIGSNVGILMPKPYRDEHDSYIDKYRKTGRRRIIGIGREVVGLRKNGETFPLDLAVSEVQLGGRRIFTGIVRDITDRRKLEQEILEISEQERRRIGQDLHDGLGQMLTGIGLISRNLARKLEEEAPVVSEEVSEITDLIKEADQYARGLARSLVPVELDASGLAAALQRLAHNAERLFGIRCTFEEVGTTLMHDNTAATHLYRIAQEAVSNAVKHGRAVHVAVTLASGDDQVRLRVQDDGVGFPDQLGENRGMGVRIMHHRARIIGASLEIRRAQEGGTILTCTLQRTGSLPLRSKKSKMETWRTAS